MMLFEIGILTAEEENIYLSPPKFFNIVTKTSRFLKCFKFLVWPFIHNCRNLYIFTQSLCILIRKFHVKPFNTTCVNMATTLALMPQTRQGVSLSALSNYSSELFIGCRTQECLETLLWSLFRDVCKPLLAAEALLAFGSVCISQCLLHGIFKEQQFMEICPVMFALSCRMVN